ncbi:MAG: hypothetical protein DRJ01_05265 [Bacteroidetes bacterium]|nr:MAG: hypothetical protein DRJ01_05265 [Bacteroidota bacterium]
MNIKYNKIKLIKKIIIPILLILFFLFPKVLSSQTSEKINDYLQKIEMYESEGNNVEKARYLNKLAFLYWDQGNYDKSIDYFNKSLVINIEIGNNNAIKSIYTNIGMIYSDKGDFETSILYFRKSLKICELINNQEDIAVCLINLSVPLVTVKRYDEANNYILKALDISKQYNNIKLMRTCYGMLSENYKKIGDDKKASYYFNLYASFQKKIQDEQIKENQKKMQEVKMQAYKIVAEKETELKNTENSLLKEKKISKERQMKIVLLNKEKEIKELKIKEQKAQLKTEAIYRMFLIVGFVLIGIIAFVVYRGYKQKKQANLEISRALNHIKFQNLNITRSINYAQRIQDALLPGVEKLKRKLPESFIFFKPRDIVSGDFYWFSETNPSIKNQRSIIDKIKKEGSFNKLVSSNNFIVSAVDCTGHGVPGAFMSMIGINILNEIISRGIVEADLILNELHKEVRYALKQEHSDNKDGMDMSLCVIKEKEKVVEFAGANNPVVYIQNNELKTIKGDRKGIGGEQKEDERIFTKHTIKVDTPTIFYLFSDGYIDQFGGHDGRKLFPKYFRQILLEIHDKPMQEQRDILEKKFDEWKGVKYQQVDDVLVIGFKVG